MTTAPLVSVLVASYNYQSYLPVTLQSVLDQTWEDWELLVLEDGSTDHSLEIAQGFAARDRRVRVVQHPQGQNRGLPATLALGLDEARGQYIAFLESDDIWEPQSLALRLQAARQSDAGVVFNDIAPLTMPGVSQIWFDAYVGRVMQEHAQRAVRAMPTADQHCTAFTLGKEIVLENKIPTFSCAMVRSDLLRACSWQAPVARWLDWWLWGQLAQMTRFAFVPEKLTYWRLHRESQHHKLSFCRYLSDLRALWKGFGGQLGVGGPAARLLRLPFYTPLLVRFWLLVRSHGLCDAVRRIVNRLH